jgi:hypothetical protein
VAASEPLLQPCQKVRGATGRLVATTIIIVLGSAVLTACAASPAYTPRASDAWSRGLPLGTAILNNQVALQMDEAGHAFLVWVGPEHRLTFVRLTERAEVEAQHDLDLCCGSAQEPQLLRDTGGTLYLTWLESSVGKSGLYYAQLDGEGQVVVPASRLAGPEERVGHSRAVLNPAADRIEVFWSDDRPSNPGVYHLTLDGEGNVIAAGVLIVPEGLRPDAQVDREGLVHLVWTEEATGREVSVSYAVFDPTSRFLSERTEIASFVVAPGQVLHGPVMGMDGENGYIFWAVESRARETMVSHAFQTTFPLGRLERRAAAEIQAPDENAPQFDPDKGKFNYYYTPPHEGGAGLVPISVADTNFVASPAVTEGQRPELVVAFNARVFARNTDALQIVVLTLAGGQIVDYQIVSDSQAASLQPDVVVGSRGDRYLAWIDTAGFNRYQVLYASTAPQIREVLNRVTLGDVLDRVLRLGFGLLTMIGVLPLYVLWAVPAFLLLLVFFLVTQEADLAQGRAAVALGAAILLHAAIKVASVGGLVERLGLAGLEAVPAGAALVRWLGPVAVTGLAAGAMVVYIRRTGNTSLFVSFFVFVLVDMALFALVTLGPLMFVG